MALTKADMAEKLYEELGVNKREAKGAACRWVSKLLDEVVGPGRWGDSFSAMDLDPAGPDGTRFEAAVDELAQEMFNRGSEGGGALFRYSPHPSTKE